ncbi:MAG: hypothetical protein QM535_14760 [Limnohabitans sp.]|nr:hypothetical protein [Limnohabitans sp.]
MRKLQFILGTFLLLFAYQTQGQVSVSLNIGSRPNWCNHYYEERVQYVYLPELECYYDNYEGVYIYYGPRGWCRSAYLPEYCDGYDIHRAPRVVIDYRGNCPWTYFGHHRKNYWRNGYRNYRQVYYGPSYYDNYYNRRSEYVAASPRRYDNDDYYYRGRGDNGNAYGHYKKEDRDEHRGGEGEGHGRGRGRRF